MTDSASTHLERIRETTTRLAYPLEAAERAEAALLRVAEAAQALEKIRWEAGHLSEPHNRLERIHASAEAALALLVGSKENPS